ncbi:MAG: FAD-dependent oxidoreductase [Pseudomonadota bacterium]
MKSNAKVVVIGGGVVGVSTLYHLAKLGWGDEVVLVEKAELTSGSTWHAAGLLPLFNMNYSMGQIQKYSIELYQTLEEETGQPTGYKNVGSLRMATNQDRLDEHLQYATVAETIGVKTQFLSPEEYRALVPLSTTDQLFDTLYHPDDGYIQPADLTQALAKGARQRGAEIYRKTEVTAIERTENDTWRVVTDKGDIECEHVVSATGSYARQTGAMVGLDVPVIPVEHQYIVTEPHPDVEARHANGEPEIPVIRESDGSWYIREENKGFIIGPYEQGAPCCYVDGVPADTEYELFNGELDRLEPHIESAMARIPACAETGIKQVFNGAIPYTPDASPLIGPAWGIKNFWLNEGHTFGICVSGGAGWQLAKWIVEGEPSIDMLSLDPRRFSDYATKAYLIKKNEESYAHQFVTHFPDEEREAGRPLRTAPCYDRLKAMGAVFGQKAGWERPNWFAAEGEAQQDHWSFRRSRWFDAVKREVAHVTEHVGVLDMTSFAKCRFSGPGAEAFLDSMVANSLPKKTGQLSLAHALNANGGVHSEFTIRRESDQSFYLVSGAGLQRLDQDYLLKHMPNDGSVQFEELTGSTGVLVLAGPKSRQVLESLSRDDFSNSAFPWLRARNVTIGMAPVNAMRVNFIGELGWELHHPIEYQNHLFDALFSAGKAFDIKPFGIRAMDSMRLEKSYRMVGTELSIEYSAFESGLERFVKLDKGDFLGREALVRRQRDERALQFVTVEVLNVDDADALGSNALTRNGELVGRCTSGGFGFRVNKSLALGLVDASAAGIGTQLHIDILGKRYDAVVITESPFDPSNERLRSPD